MKHYLTVFLENEKQKTILLNSLSSFESGEIKVGRADDNDIILPFPSVSRHHAVLQFNNGIVEIIDAGSLNKIRVNGTAYSKIRLSDGMNVTIGTSNNVITLRYTCEENNSLKQKKQSQTTTTTENFNPSSFSGGTFLGQRLIAALADFVIAMFMCIGSAAIVLVAFNRFLPLKPIIILTVLIWLIVVWMYYALGESGSSGATMGKLMFGFKIVCNRTGENVDFKHATKRFFAKFASVIIIFVGFLPIFSGKRPLHDVLSSSRVIKIK